MPSQSPINGSTKHKTSMSPMIAGGNHQRHARQNRSAPVGELEFRESRVSGVFVVRRIWINELSFDRYVRPLNHLYAITLRIVLNFIHDVVDEEDSAARRSEQVCGVARVGNLANVEAFAFVFNRKGCFFR